MKLHILCIGLIAIMASGISSPVLAKTYVYLLAGQSNMMGKSQTHQLPVQYRTIPDNVTFYYQGRERTLADDDYFGPEVMFAHEVASALPNDQHIIVKYVASGSYISQWASGQPLYQGLLRQFSLLPDTLSEYPVDSIIWMQGESDCRDSQLAQQYGQRLQRLIDHLRYDLNSPDSLFIIGAVSPNNVGFPAVNQVRKQQKDTHQAVKNTRFVETNDLETFDNTHFNVNGLLALGKRFAQAHLQDKQ